MISDVPVGVLLSGGVDSSSICASLHFQGYENIKTFNVGFANFVDDETLLAKEVANKYQYPFYNILVEDDDLIENTILASKTMGDTLIHQNEPQLIAISKYAKQYVKVLLSGEGADELMGGYVRYRALNFFAQRDVIKKSLKLLPEFLKSPRIKKMERYLGLQNTNEAILFNSVNNFPSEFYKLGIKSIEINNQYRVDILKEAQELYPNNIRRQTMYLDQHTYLNTLNDRNDRTTMAASIECRVPFLDYRLVEGLGTLKDEYLLRGSKGKYLLKEAYKFSLPPKVLKYRKIGFSVPWLEHISKSEALMQHWNNMDKSEILNTGIFKLLNVSSIRNEYAKGDISHESLLRQLFFTSLWFEYYTKNISDKS
jgi:asparagine synthase (glutamine-hydrolysing)